MAKAKGKMARAKADGDKGQRGGGSLSTSLMPTEEKVTRERTGWMGMVADGGKRERTGWTGRIGSQLFDLLFLDFCNGWKLPRWWWSGDREAMTTMTELVRTGKQLPNNGDG